MALARLSRARGTAGCSRLFAPAIVLAALMSQFAATAPAQDIEREPIRYSEATPRNAVERLRQRLESGKSKLEFEPEHGYLKSLLRALDVPASSQVLVFSKTSLQRERISPKTPRALYFNDDIMIGFCRGGRVIEISAADEVVGTAFYTLGQSRKRQPFQPGKPSRAWSATAHRPIRASPGISSGRCSWTGKAIPFSPAGRSAPTTRARSPSAGEVGTSPARAAARSTWAT